MGSKRKWSADDRALECTDLARPLGWVDPCERHRRVGGCGKYCYRLVMVRGKRTRRRFAFLRIHRGRIGQSCLVRLEPTVDYRNWLSTAGSTPAEQKAQGSSNRPALNFSPPSRLAEILLEAHPMIDKAPYLKPKRAMNLLAVAPKAALAFARRSPARQMPTHVAESTYSTHPRDALL